jgi:hypothetical protein
LHGGRDYVDLRRARKLASLGVGALFVWFVLAVESAASLPPYVEYSC